MTKYEYKTVKLAVEMVSKGLLGIPTRNIPDLESTLNSEGQSGWRLCETIFPIFNERSSDEIILILERETNE